MVHQLSSSYEYPISEAYGECPECGKKRISTAWCKDCDIAFMKQNFRNWTSGNSTIDDFIRYTQLNARENIGYLEWIEFEDFEFVEYTNKRGAFSTIYTATWLEGPKWNLDKEAEMWSRNGPTKVVLKRLDNSQNMSQDFINQ